MILNDITALLQEAEVGTAAVDLWWGDMPSEDDPALDPDPTIAVYESPGPAGTYTKTGAAGTEARLQVLVRSEDYETAMAKALQIYELLDGLRRTVGGTPYSGRAMQRPFDVGAKDANDRTIISCNYALVLRQA